MKTTSIITLVNIVAWIAFIGLCVKTGAIIFCAIISFFNPVFASDLYLGLNLSTIYATNKWHYGGLLSFVIAICSFKAFIVYIVVQIFLKLNLVRPFSEEIFSLISKISYYTLAVGLLGFIAHRFTQSLVKQGFEVGKVAEFWNGTEAFLFMGGVVFVIAQVFRHGINLQSESDLTV